MKIEIWSDIACPYCYIGKRKLEKALSHFPHSENIELVWHSYELDPSLPEKPENKTYYQYLAEKQSITEDAARQNVVHVVALAKESGLNYNTDKLVVANTSKALRLVKLAKKYNLSDQAEEILFEAYFCSGKDISDEEVLVLLGKQIGIPHDDISKMLSSQEFVKEISDDMQRSENELNLEYIPFYLINNKHIIQGSIASEDYLAVIEKAYNEWTQSGVASVTDIDNSISGMSCSIDGVCS